MKKKRSDFGFLFWMHIIIALFWYASPFLFSWQFIVLGGIFSYAQGLFIKGCILTYREFGKKTDDTFFGYYLKKIGFNLTQNCVEYYSGLHQ